MRGIFLLIVAFIANGICYDAAAPADLIYADPVIVGPRHLLLSKRAAHPNGGKLFIDYTLSLEGQTLLASLSRTVVRPESSSSNRACWKD